MTNETLTSTRRGSVIAVPASENGLLLAVRASQGCWVALIAEMAMSTPRATLTCGHPQDHDPVAPATEPPSNVVGQPYVPPDGVERSEPPGGRPGPGRDGDDGEGGCDGSCGNQHRDCENNTGECSDDDQVQIGPICVQPESCRFG